MPACAWAAALRGHGIVPDDTPGFAIDAYRDRITITFDPDFWRDEPIDPATGTSALDARITWLLGELQGICYLYATHGPAH